MDLLFGEFIGDIVVSKKDRAVDGRRVSFWALVNSLLIALESSNPTSLPLFQNCKELTESGYTNLFSCYDKGKERLMQIYRQEVLKIDPINTKGRRAKEVVVTKTKDIKNSKKYPQSEAGPSITTATNATTTTITTATTTIATTTTTTAAKPKRSRHVTTEEEKNILTPYLKNPNPSDEETDVVLKSLLELSSNYWTKRKVKAAWGYVQKTKKR
ncbi:unnamed protein product [Rhizophagus irregularis]|nr:unnamed protein product [Rhizophagus irregularis]